MPSQQKKLSKEEIMQQLFDALMEQIEPKLMTTARKELSAELAAMTPKSRAEWMRYLRTAYEEFLDRWPAFVANATQEVQAMGDALIAMSGSADQSTMEGIEQSIRDNSPSQT